MKKLLLLLLLYTNVSVSYAKPMQVDSKSGLAIALADLATIKGFSCQFEQVLSYAEGGKRTYSGNLAVLRPGKFRWEYIKPYVQLYVGNAEGIWLYEPDLMQAQYLQDLGEVEPVVMQLLDGRVGVSEVHVLAKEDVQNNETSWYVSVGRAEQAVQIYLGIKQQTLVWIESHDVLGNRNRLRLLDVDKSLPSEALFEFEAPEGVDVIGVKP